MRTARLNLRVDEDADRLIRDAADVVGVTVSAFVEQAAVREAQHRLADQGTFTLSSEDWDAFIAELDRPPREMPGLKRALAGYRERHSVSDAA